MGYGGIRDVLGVAIECLEADDATWLARVANVLEAHAGSGCGCIAAMYGPSDPSIGFTTVFGSDSLPGLDPRRVFESTTTGPAEYTRHVYGTVVCGTVSEVGPACERRFHEHVRDRGIRDAVCVNGAVAACHGASFLILQPRRHRLRVGERRWLATVADLIGKALRKRYELLASMPEPSAPSQGSPRLTDVQLPDEAARLQAAGFRAIKESNEDGQRRLVVEPLPVNPFSVLSSRERAVVLALRTCETNKDIARLLDVSCSTVGVLLHRAAVKLRAKTRSDLLAIAREAATDD